MNALGDEYSLHDLASLQRQVSHLSLPLAFEAALDNQEQVVNGATDAQSARHLEHTGHPPARGHAAVRVLGQRRHVMRYEQASLLGSPFENGGIVGSREPDVLNAHDVDFGLSTNQSTNDVLVEVLVCDQSHDRMARLPAAGQETLAYAGWVEAPFVLFPNLGGLLLTFR